MFYEATPCEHDFPWAKMCPSERAVFDQAAAEYDKATRAELPADIEAFVAEVEARANKATPGPWRQGYYEKWHVFVPLNEGLAGCGEERVLLGFNEQFVLGADGAFVAHARADVPRLVAIVREQASELADMRAKRQAVIDGMTRAIASEGEANKAFYALQAENAALRDRLAKLESCIVCKVAVVPSDTPPHCEDSCVVEGEHEAEWESFRRELLNEKGGT